MSNLEHLELLRKLHDYGNTLVQWNALIVQAIKENNLTILHNLKMPEGFSQGDYSEVPNKRSDDIFDALVSELSDEESRRNNKLLRLSTDYGRRRN